MSGFKEGEVLENGRQSVSSERLQQFPLRLSYGYFQGDEQRDSFPSMETQGVAHEALRSADTIFLDVRSIDSRNYLAIGDSVVHTGFIAATLSVIRELNPSAHVVLCAEEGKELFFDQFRQEGIRVLYGTSSQEQPQGRQTLVIEYENIEPLDPGLKREKSRDGQHVTTTISDLGGLLYRFRRTTDGDARYDNAIRSLFGLSTRSLNEYSQPRIIVSSETSSHVEENSNTIAIGIISEASLIQVPTVDYSTEYLDVKHLSRSQWRETIRGLARECKRRYPGKKVVFNFFLNPHQRVTRIDAPSPLEEAEEELNDAVLAENANAQVAFLRLSLPDLAKRLQEQNLIIANDTGPAHIAAAEEGNFDVLVAYTDFYHGRPAYDVWQSTKKMIPIVSRYMRKKLRNPKFRERGHRLASVAQTIRVQDILRKAKQSIRQRVSQ